MNCKILDFIPTLLLTEIGISHLIIYIILNILNKTKLYFTLAKLQFSYYLYLLMC